MGRVHKKSKIIHYCKREAGHQFPVFFSFLLVDDTPPSIKKSKQKSTPSVRTNVGIPVMCWNRLCLQLYHSVEVGDILVIKNYRLRKCYEANNKMYNSIDGNTYNREISLNSSAPKALVYKANHCMFQNFIF